MGKQQSLFVDDCQHCIVISLPSRCIV
jgi:hypothetical protein